MMKKCMCKILLVLLLVCLTIPMLAPKALAADADWNYTWEFVNGVLQTVITKYSGTETAVTVPLTVDGHKIAGFSSNTFRGNTTLKTITVPDGMYAEGFGGCNVEKVIFKGKTTVGYATFSGCAKLKEVNLPKNLKEIPDQMFYKCESLTALTLPSKIESIGGSAFYGCTKLQKLRIPETVSDIENNPFAYCSSLTGLTVDGDNPDFYSGSNGALYRRDGSNVELVFAGAVSGDYKVSSKVDEIGQNAFSGAKALKSVTIPAGVQRMTYSSIADCDALEKVIFKGNCSVYGIYAAYPNVTFYYPVQYRASYIMDLIGYHTVAYGEPGFLLQPRDGKGVAKDHVTFRVETDVTQASYQWQVSTNGGKTWKNTAEKGSKTSELTVVVSAKKFGRLYRCVVTDRYSGKCSNSNAAELQKKLTITQNPADGFAMLGKNAKTTVKVHGEGLTYQWYVRDADELLFSKSSVAGKTYSFKMTRAKSGRQVYCVVTDVYGSTVVSQTATLTAAASITRQPADSQAQKGEIVKTGVTAFGTELKYQWYVKNPGSSTFIKSSATSATYSCRMSSASDGRQIYCVVIDSYGNSVKSNVVTLHMK